MLCKPAWQPLFLAIHTHSSAAFPSLLASKARPLTYGGTNSSISISPLTGFSLLNKSQGHPPQPPTVALHKTHSALLLLGAQSLQQLPNFSIMLHGLTVPVTEKILQHLLLVLETQAQLLCYLTLPGAQLAQQSCCKFLNKGEERRETATVKLEVVQGLFSLGVAERAESPDTGMYRGQKQPTSKH